MIAHNAPTLGPREAEAAQRTLSSGRIAQGPEIDGFENEFCDTFSVCRTVIRWQYQVGLPRFFSRCGHWRHRAALLVVRFTLAAR